ncbi:polysaccharide biosynthesis protein [Paraclostridium sordellii]|uniref:Polysaccharide biosynthesis protein n=1 Tax=Paraclostridium sordellii TaxID=1505 RepID=A0A0C7GB36_PARSO|nr:nucleoside-diphosphate sugar epimerase/dehydratase [Paeniclostridium sordellii]QYE97378.1 polysaccharide biosynthesis protein [Paeniclostridium sordellii]CEN79987.1 polysaccharide biosynthesis protein [[Clostridium] sordellii] [Paeniclostridium sordellii]CEQ04553.1 polysaccharide biosynthesis protein [[Clostridium] sordellii] [Paeniclostridium sordellii]
MEIKMKTPEDKNVLENVLGKYRTRQLILLVIDIACILSSLMASAWLVHKMNFTVHNSKFILLIVIYIVINIMFLAIFKCYRSLWRYAGEEELISIVLACILTVIPTFLVHKFLGGNFSVIFYILNEVLVVSLIGGTRLLYRIGRRVISRCRIKDKMKKVLIVGGGNAGDMVIQELKNNPQLHKKPVCIIDDDKNKKGRRIHNVPIIGTIKDIENIVKINDIDEIIIAIANISKSKKREIIEICKNTKCKLKTIPGVYEIIDGIVDIKKIRDVQIEDLLGREAIKVNLSEMSEYIQDKVILVTGGGGSIGSELCRQIATFNPKQIIILDNYENNAYSIQQELIRKYGNKLNLKTIIASIREEKRLDKIFNEYKPDVVFHAAAHKHVPLMENSPSEAIKNNIFGTKNVAIMADKYKVKKFVLISTDKAVNPTNIMGATKRAAEMIIQTMNEESETEFVAVRFGNVLGSNGSVIPLFKKQIEEGGPVTITHPDIIRYFMTIPEAVQLVIQAGAMAKGGEIFVLDMGDPVKIVDLANNLITLSGFEPNVDIEVKFTGLRPGEKLYEELLMSEEGLTNTEHKKIFIGKPIEFDMQKNKKLLRELKEIVMSEKLELIDFKMRELVSTYIRPEEANKKISKGA